MALQLRRPLSALRGLALERHTVLVPPGAESPFALRAGRASPPQNGGVATYRAGRWSAVTEAAHRRDGHEATLPIERWQLPSDPNALPLIAREAVYLGVAIDHFGHFLTESIHRAWALRDARVPREVPAIMLVAHGSAAPLGYQLEVLDVLGVERDRVLWVREPARVSRLWVPELASRLGEPVPLSYVTEQREASRAAIGDVDGAQPLYLHKPIDHGRGVTLGAGELARQLESVGVRTVVPERLAFVDQLRAIAGAQHVIADQGSALHLLDVIGHIDAPLSLLARPDHASYLHDFGARRSPDWAASVCVQPLPPPAGIAPATWRFTSLSRFDVGTLETFLTARLGVEVALDRDALHTAELDDLDRWQHFGPALYSDEESVRASLPEWREAIDRAR